MFVKYERTARINESKRWLISVFMKQTKQYTRNNYFFHQNFLKIFKSWSSASGSFHKKNIFKGICNKIIEWPLIHIGYNNNCKPARQLLLMNKTSMCQYQHLSPMHIDRVVSLSTINFNYWICVKSLYIYNWSQLVENFATSALHCTSWSSQIAYLLLGQGGVCLLFSIEKWTTQILVNSNPIWWHDRKD